MNLRLLLTYLWIFVTLNYLYCDVVGLMDAKMLKQYLTGNVGGMTLSPSFLFGASMLMEVPIMMILISKFMQYKWNRRLNFFSGALMTLVQIATLFMGIPKSYYLFFSIIEIMTTIYIVHLACSWRQEAENS